VEIGVATLTKLSIVSPCYNEKQSLRPLHAEIAATLDAAGIDWEWIVVDDHSRDDSFAEVMEISRQDPRVCGIRLARNAGSHIAMFCGLDHATGDCGAVLMADLEDPPSALVNLVEKWREGYKVVWASREERVNVGWFYNRLAAAYYFVLRRVINIRQMPKNGADFFLADRSVLDIMRAYRDRNISIFSLIGWLDFPNTTVYFHKRQRRFGSSKWSFGRRAKLFIDTITGFSHFPIRAMSVIGIISAAVGFLSAAYLTVQYLFVDMQPGWPSIVVLILLVGGLQMFMLGFLGEYIARVLDEVRPRPRYMIEKMSPSLVSLLQNDVILAGSRSAPPVAMEAPLSKPSSSKGRKVGARRRAS
jgi:dolichol-phosphate mannosyltransferase